MKAGHVNPFLESTMNLFESMLGEEPVVGAKSILKDLYNHSWDISGVIGVTGPAEGVVVLRLSLPLVLSLLEQSGMATEDEMEQKQMITSMVGEMTNVIAGNALGQIKQYDLDISVPFVIQGQGHSISWPLNNPVISIPFTTTLGDFEVNISLKENFMHSLLQEVGL